MDAGKIRPVMVVAANSGGYLGDPTSRGQYDPKRDLRLMEYLPGVNADRFAHHERFFCDELSAWAEKEFGASRQRTDCAVYGVSNGARFAVEIMPSSRVDPNTTNAA
jgi:hypothetical protein